MLVICANEPLKRRGAFGTRIQGRGVDGRNPRGYQEKTNPNRQKMFKAPFGYVNDVGPAENEQQERKAVKCFSPHFPFSSASFSDFCHSSDGFVPAFFLLLRQ